MRLRFSWLVLLAVACQSEPGDPSPSVSNPSAPELGSTLAEVADGRSARELDVQGDARLLGFAVPPRAETDERPVYELVRHERGSGGAVRLFDRVRSATFAGSDVLVVSDGDELLRLTASGTRRITDRVHGRPALLEGGAVVVSRRGDDPIETDLWLVTATGEPRPLAAAPGPDEFPIALPDGTLAFVSGRTSVASLWLADPESGEARQLTNRGLRAGRDLTDLVPAPVVVRSVSREALVYDAGGGEIWRVDLASGQGSRQ